MPAFRGTELSQSFIQAGQGQVDHPHSILNEQQAALSRLAGLSGANMGIDDIQKADFMRVKRLSQLA